MSIFYAIVLPQSNMTGDSRVATVKFCIKIPDDGTPFYTIPSTGFYKIYIKLILDNGMYYFVIIEPSITKNHILIFKALPFSGSFPRRKKKILSLTNTARETVKITFSVDGAGNVGIKYGSLSITILPYKRERRVTTNKNIFYL